MKYINHPGSYNFIFVSKSGFTEKAIKRMQEMKAIYLDIKDIEELFDNLVT